MLYVSWKRVFFAFIFAAFPASAFSSEKETTCFWLSDPVYENSTDAEGAKSEIPKDVASKLCMTSGDLTRYPKSVVTFTLYSDENAAGRGLASQTAGKRRILAKRHYTAMDGLDHFGHAGRPMVRFNRKTGTVKIGFGKQPATYRFKRIVEMASIDAALQ